MIVDRTTALLLRGETRKALQALQTAIIRYPREPEIHTRFADALFLEGRVAEAKEAYQCALALDERISQSWYGLGCAEFSAGAYASAIVCLRRAVAIEPKDLDARFCLGRALFHMGEVDASIDEFLADAASSSAGLRRRALAEIAKIVPGSPTRGNAEILNSRVAWATLAAKTERPAAKVRCRSLSSGEKLRVGYVSAFFGSRNWMKPVWGVINQHDRAAFKIHLFADSENPSAESGYCQHPSDSIHDLTGRSNRKAAEMIARAGLDVLVDLNGYSYPSRLGLFMRKPARILVGWFNTYATTGIRAFDYIVGDASVIPPEEERFYTERVLRVSGSYLAFRVLYAVPDVVPPPCGITGWLTFGCFAPQYKITDEVISSWAHILTGAPNARLVLKNSSLDDSSNRAALWSRFARLGVAQERVLLEPPAEHFAFLQAYGQVDIALDTFPYNGGTTTMEALWQGVHVLTFHGDRWLSRTSRSLLRAAGLAEWDMPTREEYIQRAIDAALSRDTPGSLAAQRVKMRDKLLGSPACDTVALCRDLERHYRKIARPGGEPAIR